MKANEVDFINLVQGPKQFEVPRYQRRYSWGKQPLSLLWSDILDEARRVADPATVHSAAGHFLGSIVLSASPQMGASGISRWQIVDGQQRMLSLMIALTALRDHAEPNDATTSIRIHEEYLFNKWCDGSDQMRVLPSHWDRETYTALVLGRPVTKTESNVTVAYEFFTERLEAAAEQDGPSIAHIEYAIRQRLRLVEIIAGPTDNVHRIFQTINTTGQKLDQADLVRNHLFMLLPYSVDDVYEQNWRPMEQAIGGKGLDELLWLDLVLRGHDEVPQSDVYRAQATRLDPISGNTTALRQEVAALHRLAKLYETMINPRLEDDLQLRRQLSRLLEWGSDTAHPVIMYMLRVRQEGRISADVATAALRLVEGFLVRRMLANIPTNSLGRILSAIPRELQQSVDLVGDLHKYLSAPKRYWPTDGQLADAIQTQQFYLNSRGVHRVYVLRRIEDDYANNERIDWQNSVLSIEHVMPQAMSDEWRRALRREAERFGVGVDELHRLTVHTLGNLTLTGDNPTLSNHFIDRKQQIFDRSLLAMNHEIARASSWDASVISERGKRIADRAIRIWAGPLAAADATANRGPDWALLRQIMDAIPAGSWTTFADLAEAVGTHPVSIGNHLTSQRITANAWRVLKASGRPSPQFKWDRSETPRQVLETEGVEFDRTGRARKDQRLTASRLKALAANVPQPLSTAS